MRWGRLSLCPMPPDEPTCDGKTGPEQNQARGLRHDRLDGVRLEGDGIKGAVRPCDGACRLHHSVLYGVAEAVRSLLTELPRDTRSLSRAGKVGKKPQKD